MRRLAQSWAAACVAVIGAATLTDTAVANMAGDGDSSYKYVIDKRTYIWMLPQFWMKGEESFAYIRIKNTQTHTISVYVHCHASERTIPGMSGRFTVRPSAAKVFDSRTYGTSGQALLVRCLVKSQDLADIKYMIRDSRVKNFGDLWRWLAPEIS